MLWETCRNGQVVAQRWTCCYLEVRESNQVEPMSHCTRNIFLESSRVGSGMGCCWSSSTVSWFCCCGSTGLVGSGLEDRSFRFLAMGMGPRRQGQGFGNWGWFGFWFVLSEDIRERYDTIALSHSTAAVRVFISRFKWAGPVRAGSLLVQHVRPMLGAPSIF